MKNKATIEDLFVENKALKKQVSELEGDLFTWKNVISPMFDEAKETIRVLKVRTRHLETCLELKDKSIDSVKADLLTRNQEFDAAKVAACKELVRFAKECVRWGSCRCCTEAAAALRRFEEKK